MTIVARRLANWLPAKKPDSHVVKRLGVAWYFAQQVEGVPRRIAVASRWALLKVEGHLFDGYYRLWGLDTKGPDFDHEFDGSSDFVGYVPSPWRVLRTLFPADSLRHDDVLLEYGSGKGRVVVWVVSRFRLQRVIAVDHNHDSLSVAQDNLENWRGQLRCRDVTFAYQRAAEFEVPDDVTVVYFYNPFIGETFHRVLVHLGASLARNPRTLRVIYLVPLMHDALVDAGFTVVRTHEDLFYPWTMYSIG